MNKLLSEEANRLTKSWTGKGAKKQAREFKAALIKINEDNNWDGTYNNMYRPELHYIHPLQKLQQEFKKSFIGGGHIVPGKIERIVRNG